MKKIIIIAVSVIFLAFAGRSVLFQDGIKEITVQEVKQKAADKEAIIFIDVRTPAEFTGPLGSIEGAVFLPLSELPDSIGSLQKYKDKEIIVYCRSGNRSKTGAKILQDAGFNAVSMSGGMKAWNQVK